MTKQIHRSRRERIKTSMVKLVCLTLMGCVCDWLFVAGRQGPTHVSAEQEHSRSVGQSPDGQIQNPAEVFFEANKGQLDKRVKFSADGRGYKLFLTSTEAVYVIPEQRTSQTPHADSQGPLPSTIETRSSRAVSVRMRLTGANENAEQVGVEELAGKHNYFRGKDQSKWQSNVPLYRKARLDNVYEGVDMEWRGDDFGSIEYDFRVSPHASTRQIEWQIEGADRVVVGPDGSLVISTAFGELKQKSPVTYQEVDGSRRVVESRFDQRGETTVGFVVGDYDETKSLTIDPVTDLDFSTFLGGLASESGGAIAVGSDNTVYVTGQTTSISFPTDTGIDDTYNGGIDVFVTKLDRNGSTLIYSTFLGGGADDIGIDIKVDTLGNAYVTGKTAISATPFPTTLNAFARDYRGDFDVFVSKINATGSSLIYSTFIGGSGGDHVGRIAVNAAGRAYIAGRTDSSDYPTTPGTLDTSYNGGGSDIFVTKFDANGENLEYSTFIGGTGLDAGNGIAIDSDGTAYVTGFSIGPANNYPTTSGAFDTTYNGGNDVVVSALNGFGSALVYSTFIGGNDNDVAYALALDSSRNVYITGQTASEASVLFPTTLGAFDRSANGSIDVFVTKLSSTGSALVYSTLLGSDNLEFGLAIAVNGTGSAIVTGQTAPFATPFPTTSNAYDTTPNGSYDAFLTKLTPSGSALVYSTQVGGSQNDGAAGIALNSSGAAFITGQTGDSVVDFPTTAGVFQPQINGNSDAFVSKFLTPNPSVRIVTNTNDSGAGSLRQAILDSNGTAGDDLIEFSTLFTTPQTISLVTGRLDIASNIIINGPGPNLLTVRNGAPLSTPSRVFLISNGAAGLIGMTIRDGNATGPGSGIMNNGGGAMTINNCVVTDNNQVGGDGGIYHYLGPLDIYNSTISNNGRGGILNDGGTVTITNSTVSGNTYWGITNLAGSVTITSSTITNTSSTGFAAVRGLDFSTSTVRNSIIAGNQIDITVDAPGTVISGGYNLIGNRGTITAFSQPGDQTGTTAQPLSAQLAPLASNGGATPTHALLPTSPAIDKGNRFGIPGDQRRLPRPLDISGIPDLADGSDIGAHENQVRGNKASFDFDGDGKTDIGIFRPAGSASEWWVNRSSTGVTFALQFGSSSDKIVPADYTGDGKTDIAFWKPADGNWYVLRSEDFSFFAFPFGTNGDVPVPADYDADGKADAAVFRPSSSTWFISQSGGAPTRILQFGIGGDQPVVADYDSDGRADVGIFRPGPREWWVQRSTAGCSPCSSGTPATRWSRATTPATGERTSRCGARPPASGSSSGARTPRSTGSRSGPAGTPPPRAITTGMASSTRPWSAPRPRRGSSGARPPGPRSCSSGPRATARSRTRTCRKDRAIL
ncbi:MAG TPA: choice-of-anchor Q domain-containing protein [Pyrinomonadaceae bacterium]|nr:choice-of-anchor Q domain-containing protein [Pyrinomonadaceae bacterium]